MLPARLVSWKASARAKPVSSWRASPGVSCQGRLRLPAKNRVRPVGVRLSQSAAGARTAAMPRAAARV